MCGAKQQLASTWYRNFNRGQQSTAIESGPGIDIVNSGVSWVRLAQRARSTFSGSQATAAGRRSAPRPCMAGTPGMKHVPRVGIFAAEDVGGRRETSFRRECRHSLPHRLGTHYEMEEGEYGCRYPRSLDAAARVWSFAAAGVWECLWTGERPRRSREMCGAEAGQVRPSDRAPARNGNGHADHAGR